METRKLYYEDCHLQVFAATVTGCEPSEKGFWVTLDATAFYPEGGGQAADTGLLEDTRVLSVREQGEQILHLCDKALTPGQQVTGKIDYAARFDRMQQHTGEHIVSGIVHRMFGYHNVGFHMGADVVTIDFDGMIPADALAQIEKEANDAIWKNLPVKCWYPTPEELPTLGYRTKKELPWPVRVVEVPGFDKCACCGVHVANTGEIGLVKLFSCVKFHQGVRIEMACGGKALDILSRVYDQNKLVSQTFSAKMMETGVAAQRMNDALAQEKFRANGLQKRIFAAVAESYVNQGNIFHFEENITPAALRELAEAIALTCGGIAAVFTGEDGAYSICLACPGGDVKTLGSQLTQTLNGRGGGKPGFFQGSVNTTAQEVENFFRKAGF